MHVGTYNNQYIIVDLNKFRPGAELQPGLLTIVEQMPGYCEAGDLTQVCMLGTAPHGPERRPVAPAACAHMPLHLHASPHPASASRPLQAQAALQVSLAASSPAHAANWQREVCLALRKHTDGGAVHLCVSVAGADLAQPCCCPPPQALERNYWPSYNIPYFPEVYNRSGYPQFRAKLAARQAALPAQDADSHQGRSLAVASNSLSYQLAPRAKISRRDQGSVGDLASLKTFMRSNSFRSEPFSGGSAFGAICGRGDVDPAKPRASGCNDAKVGSGGSAAKLDRPGVGGAAVLSVRAQHGTTCRQAGREPAARGALRHDKTAGG